MEWKDAVSQGAKFYDGNGDGIYNPIDKNFNGIWDPNEDMPFILGDETIFCVYNDGLQSAARKFNCPPQGIEIRQTMFISNLNDFQNVIFINYSIDNTGLISNSIDSVYFGFYADADIGDALNDLVGCDTLLNSGFTYSDTTNETFAGNYGKNPPAFFTALLQGPIVRTNNNLDTAFIKNGERIGEIKTSSAKNLGINAFVNFISGDPGITDPSNVDEARNYLKGHIRTGEIPDPCTFPYGIVKGDIDCSKIDPLFWFSGDPVIQYGWLFNIETDVRSLLSTGPFKLEKNKPQEITAAFVVGRGTDNFNSITEARRITRGSYSGI